MRCRVIFEKKFSTALSQEAEVGVKWKGHGLTTSRLDRQSRLGAAERLIWLFSSSESTTAWAGGST
jgi:hypothetical protein